MAEPAELDPEVRQAEGGEGDDEDTTDHGTFKPPAPKSLDEILKQDEEDESLKKYKKQLLQGGDTSIVIDDKLPKVILNKLAICVEGRPEMEMDLTLPKDKIKHMKIVLKEGCNYRVKIFFHVQKEIVSGLQYDQKVYRKGIRVDKMRHMVGSYGPSKDLHVSTTDEETAPSGMIARGDYKVESRFLDDDKIVYLEWTWHFVIKKEYD